MTRLKCNGSTINKVIHNAVEIDRLIFNSELIWEKPRTFSITIPANIDSLKLLLVNYENEILLEIHNTTEANTYSIDIYNGDVIQLIITDKFGYTSNNPIKEPITISNNSVLNYIVTNEPVVVKVTIGISLLAGSNQIPSMPSSYKRLSLWYKSYDNNFVQKVMYTEGIGSTATVNMRYNDIFEYAVVGAITQYVDYFEIKWNGSTALTESVNSQRIITDLNPTCYLYVKKN